MKRHQIDYNEIASLKEIELAGSYGGGEHKTLTASIDLKTKHVCFETFVNRSFDMCFGELEQAIERYNNIWIMYEYKKQKFWWEFIVPFIFAVLFFFFFYKLLTTKKAGEENKRSEIPEVIINGIKYVPVEKQN